jgi:hypothetical protein
MLPTLAALLLVLAATPALSQEERELVGLSSRSVTAGIGIGGMHAQCRRDFPGARMCTSRDIARNGEAQNPILNSADNGWVQPSNVVYLEELEHALDTASGVQRPEGPWSGLSCAQWTSDSTDFGSGLIYSMDNRSFTVMGCGYTRRVACCAALAAPTIAPSRVLGLSYR